MIGVGAVVIDVTERRRALEAEREGRRRAAFLAEVGSRLDRSLDFDQTVDAVARVVVPGFADWCAIHMPDDEGRLRQVAVAHRDPERVRWAQDLAERYPPEEGEGGAWEVLRTGRATVVQDITPEQLAAAARDPEHLRLLQELAMTSVVIVPLQSRGQTIGAVTVVAAESGRRYDAGDVELFGELGRRAGVAIENARLYTERSRIAHTLQRRLLPQSLPQRPGSRWLRATAPPARSTRWAATSTTPSSAARANGWR